MADPIVAPSVLRLSINGNIGNRPCVNVLDVVISGNAGISREEAILEVAQNCLDQWDGGILDRVNSAYQAESVSWVDLDSADGSTGSISNTPDTQWPQDGGRNGASSSSNVAILVTKQTTARRGTRNGRWFLVCPVEEDTSGNTLNSAYVTTLQAGLSQFLEQMTNTAIGAGYQTFPTVVHTSSTGTGSSKVITYEGNTQINDLRAEPLLATQRRRLRK